VYNKVMNSPFLNNTIVGLYNTGLSCADIAEIDGRSESTIRLILQSSGIKLRSRSEANKKIADNTLITLYNLGLSCSQIGTLLGIHPTTIIKRFKNIGFPMRSNRTAMAVSYSEREFNEFFCNHNFTEMIIQ
jgi:hypothetical protein